MRKILAVLAAGLVLGGCQVGNVQDRVVFKQHVVESHTVVTNTVDNKNYCITAWGVWNVVANDKKHALCDVREQWLVTHGKKDQALDTVEVSKAVWQKIHEGDKWTG